MTVSQPLVSVIVPNYNYSRFLQQRLDSIFNQTFQDYEVILLDDASTDNSAEIIAQYRNHPKVSKVEINTVNTGSPFAQWKKGIEMARGKYIWIAEADDLALPTFLEKSIEALQSDDRVALVKTMSHLIDGEGAPSPHKQFEDFEPDGRTYIYNGNDYLGSNMIWWNHFYNASMIVFRKDAWLTIDHSLYSRLRTVGDWLMWALLMPGNRVAEVRMKLSCFRLHGKSVTDKAKRTNLSMVEGAIALWNISRISPGIPRGYRWFHRYSQIKYMRRNPSAEYEEIFTKLAPEMWVSLFAHKRDFPLLWLYKHLFWGIDKRITKHKASHLKPLKVFGH